MTTELHTFVDPDRACRGYVAFCGRNHRLAAGGLRVQAGLRKDTVAALAKAMRRKERLLGLGVDGAKAGIDLDPSSPDKDDVLRRFLRFLRPYLEDRLSLGPDIGTQWDELERLARQEGIPSVKMAVARAQGFDQDELLARLRVLDEVVGGRTVGQRRAGHALAHAAIAAAAAVESAGGGPLRVAVQGFGTLGRGAAQSLLEAGTQVVAVADVAGCVASERGVDVGALLRAPQGTPLAGATAAPAEAVFDHDVDVLVLAACEDAVSARRAATVTARAVVVGANLGLSPGSEEMLRRRGVVIIPDFVAGCGGSASMDALFGVPAVPTGREVLDAVAARMQALVADVVDLSRARRVSTREAALTLAARRRPPADGRPYGGWSPVARRAAPALAGPAR